MKAIEKLKALAGELNLAFPWVYPLELTEDDKGIEVLCKALPALIACAEALKRARTIALEDGDGATEAIYAVCDDALAALEKAVGDD